MREASESILQCTTVIQFAVFELERGQIDAKGAAGAMETALRLLMKAIPKLKQGQ